MVRNHPQWKPERWRTAWLACAAMALLACAAPLAPESCLAQQVTTFVAPDAAAQAQATYAYWTIERMQSAIPMPFPKAVAKGNPMRVSALPADAHPTFCRGWKPGRGPQPAPNECIQITTGEGLSNELMLYVEPQASPPFSPPSSPTDYNGYAPFQRWTWFGSYLTYPISTIGKLFFLQNGVSYSCTASAIQRNTIATAAHCVTDENGNFSTNWLFCPSYLYNAGTPGPHPSRGCWAGINAAVSLHWILGGDVDYDFGCIVTNPTNTTTGLPVGNVTGWTGRTYNLATRQPITAFGYPGDPPFPGYHIIASGSPEWYEVDMEAGGQVSKYIGSDQTGGSSGGPWWISMRHPNWSNEYADTDGSDWTDPGQWLSTGPFINGVNSHRRCTQDGCPPGTMYTQEMGSPKFINTTYGTDESEDIFAACFSIGGS
jgi:V8-like Glu-specific endopeptidase